MKNGPKTIFGGGTGGFDMTNTIFGAQEGAAQDMTHRSRSGSESEEGGDSEAEDSHWSKFETSEEFLNRNGVQLDSKAYEGHRRHKRHHKKHKKAKKPIEYGKGEPTIFGPSNVFADGEILSFQKPNQPGYTRGMLDEVSVSLMRGQEQYQRSHQKSGGMFLSALNSTYSHGQVDPDADAGADADADADASAKKAAPGMQGINSCPESGKSGAIFMIVFHSVAVKSTNALKGVNAAILSDTSDTQLQVSVHAGLRRANLLSTGYEVLCALTPWRFIPENAPAPPTFADIDCVAHPRECTVIQVRLNTLENEYCTVIQVRTSI